MKSFKISITYSASFVTAWTVRCDVISDSTIQKLQHHYNQNKGPSLEVTLVEVQEELSASPPQVLTMEDVTLSNGVANGHVEQTTASGLPLHIKRSFIFYWEYI